MNCISEPKVLSRFGLVKLNEVIAASKLIRTSNPHTEYPNTVKHKELGGNKEHGQSVSWCDHFQFSLASFEFFGHNDRGQWIHGTRLKVSPRSLWPNFLDWPIKSIETDYMMRHFARIRCAGPCVWILGVIPVVSWIWCKFTRHKWMKSTFLQNNWYNNVNKVFVI